MNKKIIAFGEIMLRLNPHEYYRFSQADDFAATYTGAEANVCAALSLYGCSTEFVTAVPDNDIADCALQTMKKYGVGVSHVQRRGPRLGVYYLEKGASQRPSKVIYDRRFSSFSYAQPEDFDWDEILRGADWFHFTGITPPLGDRLPEICEEACLAAKRSGVKISMDLNYRKSLWNTEEAQAVMTKLAGYADVIFGNEEDAEKCLGISAGCSDVIQGRLEHAGYEASARKVAERFGCERVVYTLRTSISASDNKFQGMIYSGGETIFSRSYDMHIVDRVGGGDSFAAAAIFSMLRGDDAATVVEFATAASCLKHSIMQDYNLSTVKEIEALMNGDGSGRVQR